MAKRAKATIRIQQALMEMLHTNLLSEISVTELCMLAGVSRNTFYYHYNSPEDVYKDILEDLSIKIEGYVRIFLSTGDMYETMRNVLTLAKENPVIFSANSFNDFATGSYVDEMLKNYRAILSPLLGTFPVSAQRYNNLITYLLGGNVRLIQSWIDDDMRTPVEELAETAALLNTVILKSVIVNKN